MSGERPGGVGVGLQRNLSSLLVRSAFSAASTLCKVGKVKISRTSTSKEILLSGHFLPKLFTRWVKIKVVGVYLI